MDYDCKEPFVTEAAIANELSELGGNIIFDLFNLEPGLAQAIKKFAKMVSLTSDTCVKNNIIKTYIRYVVNEGSLFEKTRLVRNLQVDLSLHERKLVATSCRIDSQHQKMTQQVLKSAR